MATVIFLNISLWITAYTSPIPVCGLVPAPLKGSLCALKLASAQKGRAKRAPICFSKAFLKRRKASPLGRKNLADSERGAEELRRRGDGKAAVKNRLTKEHLSFRLPSLTCEGRWRREPSDRCLRGYKLPHLTSVLFCVFS